MSNIEPTEEQRAAAATHVLGVCLPVIDWVRTGLVDDTDNLDACVDLARLLAEREAKLRAEVATKYADFIGALNGWKAAEAENDTLQAEVRTLRARVAELEAKWGRAVLALNEERAVCAANTERSEAREAQHLADIKAAKDALAEVTNEYEIVTASTLRPWQSQPWIADPCVIKSRQVQQRLAHYDDAKADVPAVVFTPLPPGTTIETTMSAAPATMVRRMPAIPAEEVRRILADAGLADVNVNIGGHDFEVRTTPLRGIDSGRMRWGVRCKTCDVDVHTATTGPASMIRRHLLETTERGDS